MQRIASIATSFVLASVFSVARAGDAKAVTATAPADTAAVQDVLAAQDAGLVDVKFIPNDARSAQIVVASRVDRPLTLRLPASFGAVPVLAQFGQQQGMGGGMGMMGGGMGGMGGGMQSMGGGGMGMGGMGMGGGMGGMGGGMGQGFCWVAREIYGVHDARWLAFREWMEHDAPASLQCGYAMFGEDVAAWLRTRPVAKAVARPLMDLAIADRPVSAQHVAHLSVAAGDVAPTFTVFPAKSRVVRIATVCLDHGKREPNARVPYRMVALDVCSTDPRLADLLECLSRGMLTQKVAQAAAWHLSSGRTWEQLAAEVIEMAGSADPDVRVFSPAELLAARQFVEAATRRHGPAPAASSESASETAAAR
ncbi:MAG: hypothetical protein ACKO40_07305 [Planctomycetaceae bacterium]